MTLNGALKYVSRLQRRNEARALLNDLGWSLLPREQQLQQLSLEIKKIRIQGKSTKYLESLVDVIIDMDSEPEAEDLELGELWERKQRS